MIVIMIVIKLWYNQVMLYVCLLGVIIGKKNVIFGKLVCFNSEVFVFELFFDLFFYGFWNMDLLIIWVSYFYCRNIL